MAALSVDGDVVGGRTEGDLSREEMMEFFEKNATMLVLLTEPPGHAARIVRATVMLPSPTIARLCH